MVMRRTAGIVSLSGYIATVWLANWAVAHYGVVAVGFGYTAPAAVYFAGLAFTLRDTTQELMGRATTVLAILAGAALSAFVSPTFALASGVAFLISELADLTVYTPLRARGWMRAVLLSNLVGLLCDSVIFLWLAFHSLAFLPGQLIGKAVMTFAALLVLAVARLMLRRRAAGRALT